MIATNLRSSWFLLVEKIVENEGIQESDINIDEQGFNTWLKEDKRRWAMVNWRRQVEMSKSS